MKLAQSQIVWQCLLEKWQRFTSLFKRSKGQTDSHLQRLTQCNTLHKAWKLNKQTKNVNEIYEVKHELNRKMRLVWIPSHIGTVSKWNEMADILANEGADKPTVDSDIDLKISEVYTRRSTSTAKKTNGNKNGANGHTASISQTCWLLPNNKNSPIGDLKQQLIESSFNSAVTGYSIIVNQRCTDPGNAVNGTGTIEGRRLSSQSWKSSISNQIQSKVKTSAYNRIRLSSAHS